MDPERLKILAARGDADAQQILSRLDRRRNIVGVEALCARLGVAQAHYLVMLHTHGGSLVGLDLLNKVWHPARFPRDYSKPLLSLEKKRLVTRTGSAWWTSTVHLTFQGTAVAVVMDKRIRVSPP